MSDPLKTKCPSCNHALAVKTELVGKRAKCGHCGTVLQLRSPKTALATQTKSSEAGTVDQAPGTQTDETIAESHASATPTEAPTETSMHEPAEAELVKPPSFVRKYAIALICGLSFFVMFFPICLGLLLPSIAAIREAGHRTTCSDNMKSISRALDKYHKANGHWPPAYTVNEQGMPLHSWRSLILPFMNQQELFDKIDFSKPWDAPTNRAAADTVVSVYQCKSTSVEQTQTTYVAVVDPRGIMTGSQPTKMRDVFDGLASTIILVETDSGNAVHWMSPKDIDFDAFMHRETQRDDGGHQGGSHELMADGHVIFMIDSVEPELHELLLTKRGRESIAEVLFDN